MTFGLAKGAKPVPEVVTGVPLDQIGDEGLSGPGGKSPELRRAIRYLGSIAAGKTFRDPRSVVVYLLWLNSDHFGVARAQASQFVAYRFRLVLVVKAPPPLVIGRPLAAVVPPCDRRIYSGSKRDGVGHCALVTSEGCRCVNALAKGPPWPDRRHRASKRHAPFRNWEGFRTAWSALCEPRWQRCRFGRLLVSRIIAGDDRTRTLIGVLTRWSRGKRRSSGREFTTTR